MQLRFDCLKNICKKNKVNSNKQLEQNPQISAKRDVDGNNLMDSLQVISIDNVFTFLHQWESGNKAINRSWWKRNENVGLTSTFS